MLHPTAPRTSGDAEAIKGALTDVWRLVGALGLERAAKRQQGGRGAIICCPAHNERNPSCSVTLGPDGTIRVRCFACGFAGDALSLIAAAHGLRTRGDDYRRVLALGAGLVLTACSPAKAGAAAIVGNQRITIATLDTEVASLSRTVKLYPSTVQLSQVQETQQTLTWLIRFQINDELARQAGRMARQLRGFANSARDELRSELGPEYVRAMDSLFDTYARSLPVVEAWAADRFPRDDAQPESAYRRSIKAKALDLLRGLLPEANRTVDAPPSADPAGGDDAPAGAGATE